MTTVTADRGRQARAALLVVAVAAASVAAGLTTTSPALLRLALAGLAGAVLLAVAAARPQAMLLGVLAVLPLLGLIRRLVGTSYGDDPLLLVAPACVAVLVLIAARRGAFTHATRLTKAVLALELLALAGAANPLQGGPAVGAAGLLFVLVPTLWFWVGRALVDDRTLRGALTLVAVLGLVGAVYGLYQTYAGFPAHDRAWIAANPTYVALSVGGTTRAFGTYTAAAEYASYTGVALVVWAVVARRRGLALAAGLVLAWALALASSRGVLVLTAVGLAVVLSARLGLRPKGALALVAAMVAALWLAAGTLAGSGLGGERTADLLAHQFEGLANPFDEDVSTAGEHANMVVVGLRRAIEHPLGVGTGSVTVAAEKYGGTAANSETDLSNAAIAFGFPGLVAYLAVLVSGAGRAYRNARLRRDAVALAIVGVLAVTVFQWLNGGQYAIAPLPWLLLGVLDRPGERG